MPNPKLETYKNKATNTVYDLTDANAQASLTAILDGTSIDSFADVESALAGKVDAESGKGLSTNDYDNTSKSIVDNIQDTMLPRDEQAIVGAENFFVPFASDSKSGMTFTADADGVVDIDGTPTSINVNIKSVFTLKKGTYTVSGIPSTGYGDNKLLIIISNMNNVELARDRGSGGTFTLTEETTIQAFIFSYQAYGTYNHVKVYPMINLGTVARSFVPFAMTNRELTENVKEKIVNITAGENVTVNANTSVKCKSNVVAGSMRLEIGTTLSAGATIATIDVKPKSTVYAVAVENNGGASMPVVIGANGNIQLFGPYIPTSGNHLIIPVSYVV